MMKKLTLFTAIVGFLCSCALQATDYLEIQSSPVSPGKETSKSDSSQATIMPERIRFEQSSAALYLISESIPNPALNEPSGYYYGTRIHARLVDNQVQGKVTVTEFQGFVSLKKDEQSTEEYLTPIIYAYEQEFVLETSGEAWTFVPLHEKAGVQLRWIRHGAGDPASDLSANRIVITPAYQQFRKDTLQFSWNRDGQDTSLYLDNANFIGDEDIERAEITAENKLTLHLTPKGARKLEKSTGKAAVSSATLLAILIDNQIHSVPHIRNPITGNTIDIADFPAERQNELTQYLNDKAAQRVEDIKQPDKDSKQAEPKEPESSSSASPAPPSDLAIELTEFLLVPLSLPEELKTFTDEQQKRFIEKREQAWLEIQQLYAHYLDSHFKESELREIVRFYSSSTGKKFAEMMNLQGEAGHAMRKEIIQIQSDIHAPPSAGQLPDLTALTDGLSSQEAQAIVSDIHLSIIPDKETLSASDNGQKLLERYEQGQKKFERLYAHYIDQSFSKQELEEISRFTGSNFGKRYFKVITYQDKTDQQSQDIQNKSMELLSKAYEELKKP